jgi:DNA-binding MarR family transcriptional regulator
MARKQRDGPPAGLATEDYVRLADFRYALRRFLHFSEAATARVGLTGQQYQAMLVVRSRGQRAPVTINDLSAELLIRHHSAVGLVDRLVAQNLLTRESIPDDRRKVALQLTDDGERVLAKLALVHRRKLRSIGPGIHRTLGDLAGAWGARRRGGAAP